MNIIREPWQMPFKEYKEWVHRDEEYFGWHLENKLLPGTGYEKIFRWALSNDKPVPDEVLVQPFVSHICFEFGYKPTCYPWTHDWILAAERNRQSVPDEAYETVAASIVENQGNATKSKAFNSKSLRLAREVWRLAEAE